jgi:hypothetical protein
MTRGVITITVEPTSAKFTQDLRRSMRWDGTLTIVDDDLVPTSPRDILAPFGTWCDVQLGCELLDGSVSLIPYGHYMVAKARSNIDPNGRSVDITLVDPAQAVDRYRFETPFSVSSGTDIATMINMVVTDRTGVNPNLTSTGRLLGADRTFGLDPETGPWAEILDILSGFGLTAWYDRVGYIVIGAVNTNLTDAVALPGVTSLEIDFDEQPPNVIVVRGEPPDVAPVQAVSMDDDPGSPTYAGTTPGSSSYGRVTKFYSSPLITTVEQSQQVADQMLQESIGAGAGRTGSRGYDPTIDAGDVYVINGQVSMIDSVTVDIMSDTTMNVRDLA